MLHGQNRTSAENLNVASCGSLAFGRSIVWLVFCFSIQPMQLRMLCYSNQVLYAVSPVFHVCRDAGYECRYSFLHPALQRIPTVLQCYNTCIATHPAKLGLIHLDPPCRNTTEIQDECTIRTIEKGSSTSTHPPAILNHLAVNSLLH